MIPFACPGCSRKLQVSDDRAGKQAKCPKCGQTFAVPALSLMGLTPSSGVGGQEKLQPAEPAAGPRQEETAAPAAQAPPGETIAPPVGPAEPGQEMNFLAPAQQPDELGRLGSYRVLKVLGAGGMGMVLQAEDPTLKRSVALKVMKPELAAKEVNRQRFIREAQATAAVEHPHIVHILHVGEERGVPFLAMPMLKGEALDDRLKRDHKLPVALAVRIARQVAEGLAAAHDHGLIHRDIKPGNIWLESAIGHRQSAVGQPKAEADSRSPMADSRVKILDFGLARVAGDDLHLTQSGAIMGTPAYMAPEQAQSLKVDGRCDLFSLGVVLYRMLTGELPFHGHDTMSMLMALATATPKPVQELNPAVPEPLAELVMQLLAKDPAGRPASAHAVVDALAAIEADLTPSEPRPSGSGKKSKPRPSPTEPRPSGRGATKSKPRPSPTEPRPSGSGATKSEPRPSGSGALASVAGILGRWPRRRVLICAAVLPVILLLGIVLFWQTPQGTVRLESDDPAVEITFDKDGPTIKGADKQPITLRAGEHGLLVKRGDFSFTTDKLLIKKGATVALKVELLGKKLQLLRDGQPFASADIPLLKRFTNSLGMEFALVPKGKSWLGGGEGKEGTEMEMPYDFYMGEYEVTQGEWEKVTGINPSQFKAVAGVSKEDQKRFPVESVSWDDCQLFIKRLNEQAKETGWVYRLPKEVEWEYACRGGPMRDKFESPFDFYFDKPTNQLLPEQANFDLSGLKRTCKVGSYKPNRLGLYDMHGNVQEWCTDEYQSDSKDPKEASLRRFFGGSWHLASSYCRAVFRSNKVTSSYRPSQPSLGLRLARVPVSQEATPRLTPPEPKVEKKSAGTWLPLFNGKDLAGWEEVGPAKWTVQDGVLRTQPGTGQGWLATTRDYADFELELEYRLAPGCNSGVFLRAWKEGPLNGGQFLEIQLIDDQAVNTFGKNNGTAALFGVASAKPPAQSIPNTWHKLTITAQGRRIQVVHDGKHFLDVNLDDHGKRFPNKQGRIGLQNYGSVIEFRNLRVRGGEKGSG